MSKVQKIGERLYQQTLEAQELIGKAGYVNGLHYTVDGIYLQGSQNYGTDHEKSDVDSKLVVIPSVELLITGEAGKLSRELSLENGEKVSVKLPMEFVSLFQKGNVNNLEMLFTNHRVEAGMAFIEKIKPFREDIVKASQGTMLQAALGMMKQKRGSLFRGTVTTQPFVDQFGYDCKDAIHVVRLLNLIKSYVNGKTFEESLVFPVSEYELMTKLRDGCPIHLVEGIVDTSISLAESLISSTEKINNRALYEMLSASIERIYLDHYKEVML